MVDWEAFSEALGTLIHYASFPEVRMTVDEFERLKDYSSSVPTGRIVGKKWKRNHRAYSYEGGPRRPFWLQGEYVQQDDGLYIRWSRIIIEEPS